MTALVLLISATAAVLPAGAGEKALGLAKLMGAGMPVPVTVFIDGGRAIGTGMLDPEGCISLADSAIHLIEAAIGCKLGEGDPPLSMALRCGDKSVDRRLPQSLINLGLIEGRAPAHLLSARDQQLAAVLGRCGQVFDAADWSELPPRRQIARALQAVLRVLASCAGDADRGVLLQRMVYGDLDHRSCVGTAYTRNPYTNEPMDFGRYRTSMNGIALGALAPRDKQDLSELAGEMPEAYRDLRSCFDRLERLHGTPRYVEFAVEAGRLWLLQNTLGNAKPILPAQEDRR